MITLVEEISVALSDEFKPHMSELLPSLMQLLHNYQSVASPNSINGGNGSLVLVGNVVDPAVAHDILSKVLHALLTFGTNLDDYLHVVIPAVVKLAEQTTGTLKRTTDSHSIRYKNSNSSIADIERIVPRF
jgi:FKBP12-rapamycin complex-associated protein